MNLQLSFKECQILRLVIHQRRKIIYLRLTMLRPN